MGHKNSLNHQRLTKKQVQDLIKSEGKLHEEFTKIFEQTYSTGYKDQPLVYELSNDRFLFVFDPKGYSIPGKGDIYAKKYFFKLLKSTQRTKEDIANNRGNSVSHWEYYSKHKIELVNNIDELINELVEHLHLTHQQLDLSYTSLDVVSQKAETYGIDHVETYLYDHLVAYVGEVMRHKRNGQWAINSYSGNENYPYISAGVNGVLMPINVVWQELSNLKSIDLRKETANEIRRFSLEQR